MGWVITAAIVVGVFVMIGLASMNDEGGRHRAKNFAQGTGVLAVILVVGGVIVWMLSYGNT